MASSFLFTMGWTGLRHPGSDQQTDDPATEPDPPPVHLVRLHPPLLLHVQGLHENEITVSMSHYRPQTKLREGNVFTPVCQSFWFTGDGVYPSMQSASYRQHSRADSPPPGRQPPPGQTPPPPLADTPYLSYLLCLHSSTETVKCVPYASYWNAVFVYNTKATFTRTVFRTVFVRETFIFFDVF